MSSLLFLQYSAHVETGTSFYSNLVTLGKTHMDQVLDPSRNPIHFLRYSRISMSNLKVLNCQMYQVLRTQLDGILFILRAVSNRDPYGRSLPTSTTYRRYKEYDTYVRGLVRTLTVERKDRIQCRSPV